MVLVVKGIFASQASESDTWLAKMGEGVQIGILRRIDLYFATLFVTY